MLVQVLKALHQCAIDGGDWMSGALLVPVADPLRREEFGVTEREMQQVYSHRRAMRDLKTRLAEKTLRETREDNHDEHPDDRPGPKDNPKGGGRERPKGPKGGVKDKDKPKDGD